MLIEAYRELLRTPFTRAYSDFSSCFIPTTLDKHEILKGYLCAHVERGEAEIPAMVLPFLTTILSQPEIKWEQIAMPLFYTYTSFKSISDSIIGQFLRTSIGSSRLTKVITNKGEIYYGGQGIILDKNMEPYLLYTVTVSNFETADRIAPTIVANAVSLNVRVSPKVFNMNNMISKHIVTKMIPALTYEGIPSNRFVNMKTDRPLTPKVIIEDLSDWVKRPKMAEHPEVFNKDMKDFLSREGIIQDIVGCL